jgi:hypothetical protein
MTLRYEAEFAELRAELHCVTVRGVLRIVLLLTGIALAWLVLVIACLLFTGGGVGE